MAKNMDASTGCLIAVAAIIGVALVVAFNGLIIMLLAGAIGAALGWGTLGYGTSVLIGVALGFVGSLFRGSNK